MFLDFLSKDKINLGRQYELDLAKAIDIVLMIIFHSIEELSCFDVNSQFPTGFLMNFFEYKNGLTGASLYMFALGFGIVYSMHSTSEKLFRRGCRIFVMGYILNAARYGIFTIIISIIRKEWNFNSILFCFFNIDILQFAGLSFMFIGLLKKLKVSELLMLPMAVVFQAVGSILSKYCPVSNNLRYVSGLFYYGYGSSFPFLQWFIYPAFGMLFGKLLMHIADKERFYRLLLIISSALFLGLYSGVSYYGYDIRNLYVLVNDISYKQNFFTFQLSLFAILIEISLLFFFLKRVKSQKFEKIFLYLSNKINQIYIIQWVLIGLISSIMSAVNSRSFTVYESFAVGILVVSVSLLISKHTEKSKTCGKQGI